MPRLSEKEKKARTQKQKAVDLQQKRYEEQERKRAPRVQIDQSPVLWLLEALVAVSFAATVVLVANGTYAVSQFIGLPLEWLGWLVFFGIEVMVLISLLFYLILESRGDNSKMWFGIMIGYSVVTIITNAFHTLEFWEFAWLEPRMWAGVVLSTAVPLSFVLATKGLSSVVFAKAIRLEE